jgi:hypothetical protein
MIVKVLRGARASSRVRPSKGPPRFRPQFLRLEDRALPSTYTVLNLADSGSGSLRQAISDANTHAGPDVVRFAPGLHGTIRLTSGVLNITDDLSVNGPGANLVTVSGSDASRVFHFEAGVTVAVKGLTIAHGSSVDGAGGAIDNGGTLSLTDCAVVQSRAAGGTATDAAYGGGGILNESGATLTLARTAVADDTAQAGAGLDVFGGGLLNLGTATVSASTFSGDIATGGAGSDFFGGSVGGAIANFGGATLTVSGCRFVDDQAVAAATTLYGLPFTEGVGGAIENDAGFDLATPSTATISNSLFIGNLATAGTGGAANGGAIDNEGTGSTLTVSSSVVTGNLSLGGPGIKGYLAQGIGGGIMNFAYSTLTVQSSVISGNKAVGGDGVPTTATQNGYPGGGLGGGVENLAATATISGSTIIGNTARAGSSSDGQTNGANAAGGGIDENLGSLTVLNSLISGNVAVAGRGNGSAAAVATAVAAGGGIDIEYPGTASITGSIISGNAAIGGAGVAGTNGGTGAGGGIAVDAFAFFNPTLIPAGSAVELANDAIAFNQAVGGSGGAGANGGDGLGGGLFMFGTQANPTSVTLTSSSVQFNDAQGGARGAGGVDGRGVGGGIYNDGATLTIDPTSVVRHNRATTDNDDFFP